MVTMTPCCSKSQDQSAALRVTDLRVRLALSPGLWSVNYREVVKGVTLEVGRGETFGLVGRSGCGKTTLARAMLGLIPATGEVWVDGQDLLRLRGSARRRAARSVQAVFQDPGGSLNPSMTVVDAVAEPLVVHGLGGSRADRGRAAGEMLERCGIGREFRSRLPRELSGGQRQRVAIARALMTGPEVLICDEPTSALDASVQAQIVNLLMDLQRERGMAMLLVTHDLGVVAHMAERVGVMDAGELVETGSAAEVLENPRHSATKLLLEAPSRTLAS